MSSYAYVAVDPQGTETRGTLEVLDQNEALRRIKEMGLFPTKVFDAREPKKSAAIFAADHRTPRNALSMSITIPVIGGRIKPAALTAFTRQLATLTEAGMPLLRGLRTLQEQETNQFMKQILGEVASAIEGGSSLTEALAAHPRIFNRLYVNMVKAGEIGGALEVTLKRLAEFMEKAQRIKGKVKAAMFYPAAVMIVAIAILGVMMTFVVPRFKSVFEGLNNGKPLPAFTRFVFDLSEIVRSHLLATAIVAASVVLIFWLALKTRFGRWAFDQLKLVAPILGPVFRKAAISRFARTLGTLVSSGVPILQALTIVKETTGNVVLGRLVSRVHENVKQGDPIAPTLKSSRIFPAMVAGMVDIGEQTGALPEMLIKIADNCDEEVDNATNAMTSLLEPIMIIFLAVIVGGIVIAMFLPILAIMEGGMDSKGEPEA